jgi:uncharacterized membrane protein
VGRGTTGYDVVLVLHILASIVGFGTVVLNGVRGAHAKARPGPGGLAIGESAFQVSKIAELFIYTVPIFGIGLVFMSDDAWEFEQAWIAISIVLYIVGLGISHGVMMPSEKKMNSLAAELVAAGPPPAGAAGGPPPQVAQMEALEKKLAIGGTVLNLLLVVIVVLMVFKPGV